MHRYFRWFLVVVILAAPLAAAQSPTQEPPVPSKPEPAAAPAPPLVESMKIICDGKVKTDGLVVFVFTPSGGQGKEIRVTLQKGMNRKDICRDIAKEVGVAISGLPYELDRYDADKIKIKGKKHAKFSVTLGGLTATGVVLELK